MKFSAFKFGKILYSAYKVVYDVAFTWFPHMMMIVDKVHHDHKESGR